ncbi:MAG: hypothetical protein Q9201_002205 [Fulgogasparrea decipioides]
MSICCHQIPLEGVPSDKPTHDESITKIKNVAIIGINPRSLHRPYLLTLGADPAGAATAYFLNRFSSRYISYNITIFEREAQPGGRVKSTTIPDHDLRHLEIGASHFSREDIVVNEIIESLDLNREIVSTQCPNESALWNGQHIVARVPTRIHTWRDWVQMTRLYGLNFLHATYSTRRTLSKLHCLSKVVPILNIYDSMERLGVESSLWWTPSAYLRAKWISGVFLTEFALASIRASIGQNIPNTNAYYLTLALQSQWEEPLTLTRGISQLIGRMLEVSRAKIHLSRPVTGITIQGSVLVRSQSNLEGNDEKTEQRFDSVIVAAPWASTGISVPNLVIPPSSVEYTGLHITHFATPLQLNPDAFNIKVNDTLPDDITMPPSSSNTSFETSLFDFFRLTKVFFKVPLTSAQDHRPPSNIYRLLTAEPPTTSQLMSLLNISREPSIDPIIWQHSQHWPFAWPKADYEASPYFTQIADGFYTTANIELTGSRLEAAMTMGMNVAEIVDKALRSQAQGPDDQVPLTELEE